MTSYGIAGLFVLGCVLALVVFQFTGERPSAGYTRVVVPRGSAGSVAADGGVTRPEPLPSRERVRTRDEAPTSSAGSAACAADGGRCDLTVRFDCDPRKLRCRRSAPRCAQGQVPSVAGSCFGECVPIEACRCNGPEECPAQEQYTCLLSAHHCTPYLH